MKNAEARRRDLEEILARVHRNRIAVETSRIPRSAALKAAQPEPFFETADSSPNVVPEPPPSLATLPMPAEPPPLVAPLVPDVMRVETVCAPIEPASLAAAPEVRVLEATPFASRPVTRLLGALQREWTLNAVLDRAWKLGRD
ncbi:MAG: hypothetical protein PHU25_19345 [Deltaproteobacteria bacterium]|nr:hypothetical protein [Deltaproteobacteria bacterium]